jgi:hypothetical protein
MPEKRGNAPPICGFDSYRFHGIIRRHYPFCTIAPDRIFRTSAAVAPSPLR